MKTKVKVLEVHVYNKEKGEMRIERLVSETNLKFKQATEELELSETERVINIKKDTKTIDIPLNIIIDILNKKEEE